MKYRSLAIGGFEAYKVDFTEFNSVKSHRWVRALPAWTQQLMTTGVLSPVVNHKNRYMLLENKNATFRIFEGDYIVKNSKGLIFWMPALLFQESFRIDTGEKITEKQQKILDYLADKLDAPSIRELMRFMGYKSTSAVHRHLKILKEKGYIDWDKNKKRGLRVI